MIGYDVAIIGAGIAGATLAAEVAPYMSVLLLETEGQPGYHATGRSNAFWHQTYGGPLIEPLTTASLEWLRSPPPEISETGFLSKRGAITIGRAQDQGAVNAFANGFAGSGVKFDSLNRAALLSHIAELREEWDRGLYEENCYDIDVAAYHAAVLRVAKYHGGVLVSNAQLTHASRRGGHWQIVTRQGDFEAAVLVNAAGAWADDVARISDVAPIGVKPYRRTIVQLAVDSDVRPDLPMVIDINGGFYFKPGAGRIWLSPHDETQSPACDAAPEEYDIALAIDRFEKVVDWGVRRVEHSWAGLRSFAPDRLPVYGFDQDCEGFFWCVGQGGFGIQTAPAAAKLGLSLISGKSCDPMIAAIDPARYAPGRFAK